MESNYFYEKTLFLNNRYFWYTLLCDFCQKLLVFLFQKALTPIKLNIFVPKGNNSTKNWMIKDLLQLNVIFLISQTDEFLVTRIGPNT